MSADAFRKAAAFAGAAFVVSTCTSEQVTVVNVSSVDVLPPSVSTVQGDRTQLHATVLDERGQPLSGAHVTWTSSDPSVASVDATGQVTAHKVGSAEIRATFRQASGKAAVVVMAGPSIAVGRDSIALFAPEGGSPPEPEIVSVFNAGSGSLAGLAASAVYPEGGPTGWLEAALAEPTAPTSLSVGVHPGGLGTGVYRADVLIAADEVTNSPVTISVALAISGFSVTESGGTTVTEAGSTDSFTAVLGSRPRSNVVLTVVSADAGEVTVHPGSLTFTPSIWDVPQTVTVTGVDDTVDDGDQTTTVLVAVDDLASDEAFDDLPDRPVDVTTVDDDAAPPPPPPPPQPNPGILVTESGGTTSATEGGPTDAFTVRLQAQPATNVVLTVTSANTAEATADPNLLTFTPLTWSAVQSVTVAAVDDLADDGDRVTNVTVSVSDVASDNAYDGVPDQTVAVTTVDNDATAPPPPPPPSATRLSVTQQPPSVQPLLSTFTVAVVATDADGDVVPSYTGPVTLSILKDASLLGNARLVGTTTVNAVSGVARFTGIRVDQLGTGYTLRAVAPGLTAVTTNPFTVVL